MFQQDRGQWRILGLDLNEKLSHGLAFDCTGLTGPLPKSIDSPLVEADKRDSFNITVFDDPQPCTLEGVSRFRADVIDLSVNHEGTALRGTCKARRLELATSLSHFIDLCRVLRVRTSTEHKPTPASGFPPDITGSSRRPRTRDRGTGKLARP